MSSFLHIAGGVLAVILLFFLAIMVHEFGHFIVAKKLGFAIDAFSICFGPALWKRKVGGVEYRIGCIPLGGYVALPQLDPSSMDIIQGGEKGKDGRQTAPDAATEAASAPPHMAPWKRILVALAGPAGNVVLAVVLAFLIFAFAPRSDFGGEGTVIGVVHGERAEASGIRIGDEIVSVAGQPVAFWSDIVVESHLAGDDEKGLPVTVMRGGEPLELVLPVKKNASSGFVSLDGISPWLASEIAEILPDGPAARTGLKKGDRVLTIGGSAPTSPSDAVALVRAAGTNAVSLSVERRGSSAPLAVEIVPEYDDSLGRAVIGVVFADPAASIPQWMTYRNPLEQLSADAKSIVRMLRALFAPKAKGEQKRAAKGMGGPGTLLFILWNEVHSGFFRTMAFLRFLCINLAILNLLPLPVLDGGHILFALAEIVTRRRPSPKFVDYVTTAFAVLLIGLMALLLFRDAVRIRKFVSRSAPAAEDAGRPTGAAPDGD